MKTAEIRQLKRDDLHAEVSRLERHLFDLRAQAVTEKLADPTQLGKTRRDIARFLTIIRENELAATPKATRRPATASIVATEKPVAVRAAPAKAAPKKTARTTKAK